MKTIYSPNNINVLLHYHCSCEPHPRLEASAVSEALQEFLRIGALVKDDSTGSGYRTTPMGQAWVQALCNVAPPQQAFVDEHGTVLLTHS